MDRVAVFVDAGYLFAQGSKELCGVKLSRGSIGLDHSILRATLTEFAERLSGLPLLRIYWYDGTSQGPSAQHITLADQPGIKVRLGLVNQRGQQKGVDSLVVTDMLPWLAIGRWQNACFFLAMKISGLVCSKLRNTGSGCTSSGSGPREGVSPCFFSRKLTRRTSGRLMTCAHSSIAGRR